MGRRARPGRRSRHRRPPWLRRGRPAAGAPPGAALRPPAPAPAAPTSPLIAPSITGPLAIQLPPPKYTLGPLGDIYVDGIGSGLVQWQNNPFPGNRFWQPDLSNGQIFVQKTDGIFQFYAQAGAYSISSLGTPYISAAQATWLGAGNSDRVRQFVGLVSARLCKDRPDRQFLDPGRQTSDPDRG